MLKKDVAELLAWCVNAGRSPIQHDLMVSERSDSGRPIAFFNYAVTDKREDGFTFSVLDGNNGEQVGPSYNVTVSEG